MLDDAYNDSLLLLEERLAMANKSLRDFPEMPLARAPVGEERLNPYLVAELDYDQGALRAQLERNMPLLNQIKNGQSHRFSMMYAVARATSFSSTG
jgi:hypothetical protein